MGVDHPGNGNDGKPENVEKPPPQDKWLPPPDQPGSPGQPSRIESWGGVMGSVSTGEKRDERDDDQDPADDEQAPPEDEKPDGTTQAESAAEPGKEAEEGDDPGLEAEADDQNDDGQSPAEAQGEDVEQQPEQDPPSTDEVEDEDVGKADDSAVEEAIAEDRSDSDRPAGDAEDENGSDATATGSEPAPEAKQETQGESSVQDPASVEGQKNATDTGTGAAGDEEIGLGETSEPDIKADESDDLRVGNNAGADLDEETVERGMADRLKQIVGKLDRSDKPSELTGTVDRPDFQDPHEDPRFVPDRYGTPLERADGTRIPLFDGEPTREQTRQGGLGDCGIIAALGSVAGHQPEVIRDCVREIGDGNYEVRLHEAKYSATRMRYEPTGKPITLVVTPDLPVFDSDPGEPAFADSTRTKAAWAPVLEKAIAGTDQTWDNERSQKWTRLWNAHGNAGDGPEGYVRLNQGSTPGDRSEVLTQLTGQPAKAMEFPTAYDNRGRSPDRQLVEELRGKLADHKPVLVGTKSVGRNDPPLVKDLRPDHVYEVTKVDDQGRLYLRNPWNRRHPQPLSLNEFKASVRPRYNTLE